jgi:TonB family protein
VILTPIVIADASPSPAATNSACPVPNRGVTITNAATPDFPPGALQQMTHDAMVVVRVTVAPDGNITKAEVVDAGGNASLGTAALRAAVASTYVPKIVNCQPTTGTYEFRAEFTPP